MNRPKYLLVLAIATSAFSVHYCGSKPTPEDVSKSTASESATATVTISTTTTLSSTVTATTTASTTETEPSIWISSGTHKFLVGYSTAGVRVKLIDLANYVSSGGITAIDFLNRDNIIAFADLGASGEKVLRVNLSTGVVDNPWYSDGTNLNNVTVNKIILDSANSRFFVHKGGTATTVESVSYNLSNNVLARQGAPFYTLATCVLTTNQYIMKVVSGSTPALLLLSSGTNARINTIRNLTSTPVCTTSSPNNAYNYGTTTPANSALVPVGGTQLGNGKVFIRYQHASTPSIYSYDFDGNILSGGTLIFSDSSVLGTNTSSRELVALDATTLIGGDWNSDAIFSISTSGTNNGLLIRDGFSVDVSSIAIRPSN